MQNKNDAVGQASHAAALLVTLYEGDEIQDAARILIEQEIEIEELRGTLASQSGAEVPSDARACIRALAMAVAEDGIKAGSGSFAAVARDKVSAVVDAVLTDKGGLLKDIAAAFAQHSTKEVPSAEGAVIDYGSPQGVISIDTPEFNRLLGEWMESRDYYQSEDQQETKDCWSRFIAHIDARLRQVQPVSRDAVLEEAALQCEAEKVHVQKWHPSSDGDEAYNAGCNDCARAVRALASSPTAGSGEDGKQGGQQ